MSAQITFPRDKNPFYSSPFYPCCTSDSVWHDGLLYKLLQINVYTQTLPVKLGLEKAKHNLFNTLEVCVKVLFSLTYTLTGRYDNITRGEWFF